MMLRVSCDDIGHAIRSHYIHLFLAQVIFLLPCPLKNLVHVQVSAMAYRETVQTTVCKRRRTDVPTPQFTPALAFEGRLAYGTNAEVAQEALDSLIAALESQDHAVLGSQQPRIRTNRGSCSSFGSPLCFFLTTLMCVFFYLVLVSVEADCWYQVSPPAAAPRTWLS